MEFEFSTGDEPTDFNLKRLGYLADPEQVDGDFTHFDTWIVEVILSIRMLPRSIKKCFSQEYYIGDSHCRMKPDQRVKKWLELVGELQRNIEAARHELQELLRSPEYDCASDRPKTKGERVIELCGKAEEAGCGTEEFDRILAKISLEAASGIGSDVQELKKLSRKKRIADVDLHRYWVIRHLGHIRIIARQLHHKA